MADLTQALDAALRERYPLKDPKTPITRTQGLKTRMGRLEKLFSRKDDRKGAAGRRAAEAAGVTPGTWTRWRSGKQRPSMASLLKLEGTYNRLITLPDFRKRLKSKKVPNRVRVSAEIKWSKSPAKNYNQKKQRTTDLESMRNVMVTVIRAWAGAGPEAAAEAFERGAAEIYRAGEIAFEGDQVTVEFLEEEF